MILLAGIMGLSAGVVGLLTGVVGLLIVRAIESCFP